MSKLDGPDAADWSSPEDAVYDRVEEPTRFAWIRDGELGTGTLMQWARMWEGDYYAGDSDLTGELITWDGKGDPERWRVSALQCDATDDDMIPWRFTVPGLHDMAMIHIDGRN